MKRIFWGVSLTIFFGVFFHIKPIGMCFLIVGTGIVMMFLEGFMKREEERKKDFFQLTEYMQGMGMSFLLSGAEYPALKETITLFEDCKLRKILWKAQRFMEQSMDGKGGEGAFGQIEQIYPCKKLRLLHSYMLTASKVGGKFQNGIGLLLRDQEMWKKRQTIAYENLKADKKKVTVSIGLTILLCGYVGALAGEQINITDGTVYQVGMILFWCGCVATYVMGQKCGRMDWFEEKEQYSPEEVQDKLMRYRHEQKRRKIGYKIREKILRQELVKAFPGWMLEVALRMESKNVEVALEESREKAPVIIRFYLDKMLGELREHPGDGEPYLQFARELHVPEITNSMKLLYGISKGVVFGGDEQIRELIERNYQLENLAGNYRLEKQRSIMYGFSLLPSLLGAGCMILNMSLLLLGFVGNLKI